MTIHLGLLLGIFIVSIFTGFMLMIMLGGLNK